VRATAFLLDSSQEFPSFAFSQERHCSQMNKKTRLPCPSVHCSVVDCFLWILLLVVTSGRSAFSFVLRGLSCFFMLSRYIFNKTLKIWGSKFIFRPNMLSHKIGGEQNVLDQYNLAKNVLDQFFSPNSSFGRICIISGCSSNFSRKSHQRELFETSYGTFVLANLFNHPISITFNQFLTLISSFLRKVHLFGDQMATHSLMLPYLPHMFYSRFYFLVTLNCVVRAVHACSCQVFTS